jgi:hypothetical protein
VNRIATAGSASSPAAAPQTNSRSHPGGPGLGAGEEEEEEEGEGVWSLMVVWPRSARSRAVDAATLAPAALKAMSGP